MSDLPRGWSRVRLLDVGTIVTGNTPPKRDSRNYGKSYPWVKPPDLGSNKEITETDEYLSEYGAKKARLLPPGTVLVSCIGLLGKVGYAGTTLATNQQINSVIFDKEIVFSKYGFYYSKALKKWLEENASATTVAIINKTRFSEAPFLLPPLNEQCRIVAKLEKLLGKVDACKERLERIPIILKRFRQSVLVAASSGRLTADWREQQLEIEPISKNPGPLPTETELLSSNGNLDLPESWIWAKLPRLGHLSRGRSRHRPRDDAHLYGGKYPFIQTGDIAQSGGRITSHRQTYNEAGLAQSKLWPEATVCITIAANIADSAILTYSACFPDSVVGFIANREICLPEYVEFFIRTARKDLSQFAPATAQKNINVAILNEVLVPLAPLPEQQEIVRRVEALFKVVDRIEERYKKAKDYVDKLTQSILAKAIRGELVPQDPNDEPASMLLERIREERSKNQVKPRGRKTEAGKRRRSQTQKQLRMDI